MGPQEPEDQQGKIERLRRAMYSRSLSPNLKDRPRRVLRLDEPQIGDTWHEPEASISPIRAAPATLGVGRFALRVAFFAAVAFFIGALGFFGYYFFLGGGSSAVSPGNIDIVVSGPSRISSGVPSKLQITIVNRNQATLEFADLVITYPPGTRSSADFMTDLPTHRESLGAIEPGGRRQGVVPAVFSGIEGSKASVKVELEYRLSNSSAIFVASTDYTFTFESSPVSIAVEGNVETISGQPIELTVTVSSNADAPLRDVVASVEYPFGFTFTSAEPSAKSGNAFWELGDLVPGEKKTIVIRGVLSGESGDRRIFKFIGGTRDKKTLTSVEHVLADYAHTMLVSQPFLGLSILVNRDLGGSSVVVGPGETVNVTVQYQNNLATAVTDAVIVARLSGVAIDGSTVRSTDGFYRSSDNAMLWDKTTTNGALATLAPGARGSVNFSFQMPSGEALEGVRNPELNIAVYAAGKRVSESGVPQNLQATVSQTLRLASDLQVIAQGLYYANPFGSTGPMPPKANSETTYAVAFSITNTTNEIRNAKLTASLPPYVRWTGIYSPGITFNPHDSTLTWDIGTIEAGTGLGGTQPKQAVVTIGFMPSTSQIGQQPELLRAITLTGTDAAGKTVTKTANTVTTNIVGDPGFAPANATVVK